MADNHTEILESKLQPVYLSDDDNMNLSVEKLDQLGKELNDRFTKIKGFRDRAQWEEDKAESLRAYHLEPPTKPIPYEGAANLRCIFTRLACDSLHANFMYAIFGQGNHATIVPHYLSQDMKSKADKAAQYLTYQLAFEADFYSVLDDADLNDKIFGIAYLKPRYERQVSIDKVKETIDEEVPDFNEQGDLVGTKKVKKTKVRKETHVVFDGVKIDSLPVESVYVSPFIPRYKGIDYAVQHDCVFEVTSHTLEDVKLLTKDDDDGDSFYIKSQVERLRGVIAQRLMDDTSQLEQARRLYDGFTLGWYLDQQIVELAEAHLWKDIDGDGDPEKITVVFELKTGIVIRVALTPCRIVDIASRPVNNRFYGESTYKAIKPLCDEWEAIHNSRVNAGAWENTVFGVYRAGGRFNPEERQIIPGHFYPVDDPREVQFVQRQPVGSSYFQEEGLLLQYVERILGITDNVQGLAASGDQTATESLSMNQHASIRMGNPLNRIVTAIERLLNHIWDLNQQCAPESKEFYVVGIGQGTPLFDKMKREDFAVQTKFKLDVQNIFDKQLMQQTWLMAFKMFSVYPPVMMNPATSYQLFKQTLGNMGINLDIPKPPQAEALSPTEVLELIEDGKDYDPMPGVDYDEHLKQYAAFMETEEYEDWTLDQKRHLFLMIKKMKLLKSMLEKNQLNKSGVYDPGPMAGQAPPSPAMTMNRNPTQTFNTLRAGETGQSMQRQPMNAVQGSMMGGAPNASY